MKIRTTATESDEWSVEIVARCDGKVCGSIDLTQKEIAEDRLMVVDIVEVAERYRRKGVATKLYEAAALEACRHGSRLASTTRVSEGSEGFWAKQTLKGRVSRYRSPEYPKGVIVLKDCRESFDLSATRALFRRRR